MGDKLDELIAANPQLLAKNSRYAPKMSFADRCAVLAAYHAGIVKSVLSEAYGINISTVEYIVAPNSSHYRNVRKERADLGPERFRAEYMTEEQVSRIMAAKDRLEGEGRLESQKARDARLARERAKVNGPDKRANGVAGRHLCRVREGTLFCEVVWAAPEPSKIYPDKRPEGWYVTVSPDSPGWVDGWGAGEYHGYAENANTSKAAWRGFLSVTGAEESE